jgi:AhpD family alkylhydroperoxidase
MAAPDRLEGVISNHRTSTAFLKEHEHMSHADPAPRLDYAEQTPDLVKRLQGLSQAITHSGHLESLLALLVDIRASQLNGCAFCLDMHVKEARMHGERELRLHHVATWHDSPLFSARERAALALTEALCHLEPGGVSAPVYEAAQAQFSPVELSTLVFRVAAINAWNRLNVAFRTLPGTRDKALGLDKAGLA